MLTDNYSAALDIIQSKGFPPPKNLRGGDLPGLTTQELVKLSIETRPQISVSRLAFFFKIQI
jgi:hypothetical protein